MLGETKRGGIEMTSAEKKRMIKTKRRLRHESNRKNKRKWSK